MFGVTDDLRIRALRPLIPPAILIEQLPVSDSAASTVTRARDEAAAIIHGKDDRLLVVAGPCSIHNPEAALDYAGRLKREADRLSRDLCIIMRVYFEKPRTTVGWKGLINDPDLDGSFNINKGLHMARKLLLDLGNMGLPAGTEFLDTISPQFIADLVSWGAIGARTTESQVHRELASGLSVPVGFKNGTGGDVQIAIDAIAAAQRPHYFLSVTKQGLSAIVSTKGNRDCHVILRGSHDATNFDPTSLENLRQRLENAKLDCKIMVDASHGNSGKDYRRQPGVVTAVAEQVAGGARPVCGVMIESHLLEGRQTYEPGKPLVYGQSITDACVSWETTVPMLDLLAAAVRTRRTSTKSVAAAR